MAVQLMPRVVESQSSSKQHRFAVRHSPQEFFCQQQHQRRQRQGELDNAMAQSCLHPAISAFDIEGDEQPSYENLDCHGRAIPEDLLVEQFPEIQPAYVTLLKDRMTDGESTAAESEMTAEERPPAPLPAERNFLDDLVIQKLQTRPKKSTPTAAVQRHLGYEDTELSNGGRGSGARPKPEAGTAKQSGNLHSRSTGALPANTGRIAGPDAAMSGRQTPPAACNSPKAPKPKPRPSLQSTSASAVSSTSRQRSPPPMEHQPAVVSSCFTPEKVSRSGALGNNPAEARQTLRLDGQLAEWFHGPVTRKEADRLLKDQPVGAFLVRIGERHLGYSLSVKSSVGQKHFMITQRDEKEYLLGTNPLVHRSMHNLIQHFKKNGLNSSGDTLGTGVDYTTAML